MVPTRVRLLVALAVLAGAAGWATAQVVDQVAGRPLPVPWTAAAALWVFASALLAWTLLARPRLRHRPGVRPLAPIVAARTAALSMAASRTGALVAGFYGGAALALLPAASTEAGGPRVWAAVACVGGALACAGVALWLERLCRLPHDPDAPPEDLPGGDDAWVVHPRAAQGRTRASV